MIFFKKLVDDAVVPARQTAGAAGFDLHANESVVMYPGDRCLISTGVAVCLPIDHVGLIRPRSSYAVKGLTVDAGVIDPDYSGEIKVLAVYQPGRDETEREEPFVITAGDRIAQLIAVPFMGKATDVYVLPNEHESRGAAGFGSTGQ